MKIIFEKKKRGKTFFCYSGASEKATKLNQNGCCKKNKKYFGLKKWLVFKRQQDFLEITPIFFFIASERKKDNTQKTGTFVDGAKAKKCYKKRKRF